MRNHRLTAVIVGVLYIVGTVSGILSVVVSGELLSAESPFLAISANPARLHLGAFFILVMGLSLAAMPLFLYPLLRRRNEALALGIVVFRGAIEGATYLLFVVSWLLLSAFSREFTAAATGGAAPASLLAVGNVLLHAHESIAPVLTIVFIIGAVFLYILFFQTRLIPRWLSLWGLIGAAPYLAVDLLKFFGHDAGLDFLYAPLGVQEMVMALWLIIRGFDRTALDAILTDRPTQRALQ
jgi:hypothetical protein